MLRRIHLGYLLRPPLAVCRTADTLWRLGPPCLPERERRRVATGFKPVVCVERYPPRFLPPAPPVPGGAGGEGKDEKGKAGSPTPPTEAGGNASLRLPAEAGSVLERWCESKSRRFRDL